MVTIVASMALEPAEMSEVVQRRRHDLDRCGARDGEVDLRWEFDGDTPGSPIVAQVVATRGALGAEVGRCIADASLGWEFPPRGTTYEYTLKFRDAPERCTPDGRWLHYSMGTVVAAILEEDSADLRAAEVERAESTLLEASALVGAVAPEGVVLYRYPSVKEKEVRTGRWGNAHACHDSIHSTAFDDRHELMHIVTRDWHPPPLLSEGLAVWFSGRWRGRTPDEYACDLVRAGDWLPADILLEATTFREASQRSPRAYGVAGGIVGTAIELVGVEAFLEAYRGGDVPVFVGDAECYDIVAVEAVLRSNCSR
jgi:hypothetical protein